MEARTRIGGHRLSRAVAVMLAAVLAATLLSAAPADARSSSQYKETGLAASTDWIQVDGVEPGTSPFGNVHIGYLSAYQVTRAGAFAWGEIFDFDCPEGELPDGGGHHFVELDEEEPEPGNCEFKGVRWLEGYDLTLTMDKKLTRATLTGQLIVYGGGHGEEGELGRPQANIVWTGIGGTYTSRYTTRYRDGGETYTDTWRSTDRAATMSGTLGPMGFDPDLSSGSMSSYSTSSRYRAR